MTRPHHPTAPTPGKRARMHRLVLLTGLLVALSGTATMLHAVGMLAALVLYLGYSFWSDSRVETPAAILHGAEGDEMTVRFSDCLPVLAAISVVGLMVLVGGAKLAVYGATAIARDLGMSEELIGLTLIAVGTSLPELATALNGSDGRGQVYVVEPTGPFEDDPNVTNKRFPGNITESYRTPHPMRVVGELEDWEGHAPEVLQGMLDNLARLREQGLDVIED